MISDLPRVFAEEFSRDAADCHLTVTVRGNGEVVGTFENFELTDGDKPLYATQETFTYALNTGNTAMVTIAADLLRTEEVPSLFLSAGHVAGGAYSPDGDSDRAVRGAGTVLLLFLMASAGHWAGHEGIPSHVAGQDPRGCMADRTAVYVFHWLGSVLLRVGTRFLLRGAGAAGAAVPVRLCRPVQGATVLRSALIARIARFLWRIVRSLFLGLWRIAKSLPLIWKTALAGLILVFIEFVLFMQDYYGTLAAPFLALKLAELLAVLYVALNLRALQKGGEKLARGDFSSPIDTKYLIGDFKRYGQELNDVQSGLEQAVQEQMKAEHLKTELITNVSHDIKTPLTSIVNYVDLLKKEDIPSPEAREYIAVLDRQSHRLKKLTEDLVEASKASSGVLNVDLQPTDVNVLFSQIEGEYQERLAACQLTLVTRPPAPGTVIRADSRLLSRVMDNLVSNICKYALPSTRVYVVSTLSREAVTISFKNVSRDELNISPDELMERFVRGDASRHTEGSGLGCPSRGAWCSCRAAASTWPSTPTFSARTSPSRCRRAQQAKCFIQI